MKPEAADSDNTEALDGTEGGRWEITTSHGTRHVLNLDAVPPTVTRLPAPGRESSEADLGFEPDRRADRLAVPIEGFVDCRIGRRMLIIEAVETDTQVGWRETSAIVRIRRMGAMERGWPGTV